MFALRESRHATVFPGIPELVRPDIRARRGPGWAAADMLLVTVAPYVWALSIDGATTVRGQEADVDVGLSDIIENLDIALMGEVRAVYGPVGAFVNGWAERRRDRRGRAARPRRRHYGPDDSHRLRCVLPLRSDPVGGRPAGIEQAFETFRNR